MTPYNGDSTRALKWLHNNAPNIQSLVNLKADWYTRYHTNFWTNWATNVFDLRTANNFGLMVWCIILNVPSDLFGLFPENLSWAFGPNRQNYTASGDTDPPVSDPNLPGGNYYGGGNTTILNLNEVRWALQLRYAALISDGRLSYINEMLQFIFNNGEPWDFPNKNYFYVADSTIGINPGFGVPVNPITEDHYMEYRVGAGLGLSSQFINLLNSEEYGICPSNAGTRYLVVQES